MLVLLMFPVQHRGAVTRRLWYKVKWTGGEHRGTIGLLSEELFEKERRHADVIAVIETDRCAAGPPVSGWTEARINAWVQEHKK